MAIFAVHFTFADDDLKRIGSSYFETDPYSAGANTNNKPQTNTTINNNTNAPTAADHTVKSPSNQDLHRIGSSYFKKLSTVDDSHSGIRQLGAAYEQNTGGASWFYPFFDYLASNNLYYEIRAYFVYNYISHASALQDVPISSQNNVIGEGVRGFLGYLIPITPKFTVLPFLGLWYIHNAFFTYSDNLGNSISSNSYIPTLGAKLSLELNELLALYFTYSIGYQFATLSGTGVYANANNPQVSGYLSGIEIGLPYNVNNSWSIVPYTQLNTGSFQPNTTASQPIWNINPLTTSVVTYALRVTYTW